ncbi:MAG: Spy/CpxP family protein refolding chaperone [Thermodesulfobacteriota bacterium]|nr:Spy/CpxP family protein refolding chaperone [Thermodesulfobacteriota bacterium]
MKMKWKKVVGVALVVTIMFCGTATAMARGVGPNHRGPFPDEDFPKGGPIPLLGPIMGLDFSDEQKTQIAGIVREHYNNVMSTFQSLLAAHEGLSAAILAEEFNEDDLLNAIQQVNSIRGELALLRAEITTEVRTVLSSEQIERLQERALDRMEKMKERIESQMSKLDEWLETNSE